MSRRDWTTDLGIAVVGIAAGILTFTTLRDLALAVGIRGWLAWLVPVTVDAAGVVAARVWLRRTAPADAVAFARRLAWSCIVASVAGNAGQHFMDAAGVVAPWWVVVAVSAVPPAMLGAVVHLGHLTRRTEQPPLADPVPESPEATDLDEDDIEPQTVAEAWDRFAGPVAVEAPVEPVAALPAPADPDEDPRLTRVRELVVGGAGRGTVADDLGITRDQARGLIDKVRAA